MRIRTKFPRFQEYFTLIVQFKDPTDLRCTTGKMYVGKYFTEKGEFDEVNVDVHPFVVKILIFIYFTQKESFSKDVQCHVQRFVEQKYNEFEYNHLKAE